MIKETQTHYADFFEQEVDRVSPNIQLYEDTVKHILCNYTDGYQKDTKPMVY